MSAGAALLLLLADAAPLPVQQPALAHVSAEDSVRAADAPLFATGAPLRMRFALPVDRLKGDRDDDAEERPGRIWVTGGAAPAALPVEVRTRGNFRLRRRTCDFPPLRLDFPRDSTAGTVFDGQNKLKLVVHCRNASRNEQYMLQEYLIYKIYNLFTDLSFRARLAHITYVDPEKQDSLTRYGFLLEDIDDLAARNGMVELDSSDTPQEMTDFDTITLVSLFQYFIGNTDWSVRAQHNIKLIASNPLLPYAVPYDFDWSGVISTPYAVPDPSLPIRDVSERIFISGCRRAHDLAPWIERFNANRDTIYALVRGQAGLEERTIKRTLAYFDDFYETINDPRRVERELVRGCG